MTESPSITNADDARLTHLINAAQLRVVLLTPGVSEGVAQAICSAWKRLGSENVSAILDVDPEVCRLGYGTMEGLDALREAASAHGTLVCHQPGVRIGVLIADDTTLIFSPTPLLVEAGSNQPERPNAIQLDTPPTAVARDVGLGERRDLDRVVGLDSVRLDQIENVKKDLAAAPPVRFDLARRVRVFTSRFQFVELEMTGCFISRKRVPIPSTLVGLAKQRDVQSQFHAHFNLVNTTKLEVVTRKRRVINEKSLRDMRNHIEKGFLVPLKGYGKVVLRGNKSRLLKAVRGLRAAVKVFQRGIKDNLQEQMDANAKALVEGLFAAVKANPPDAYTKTHGPAVPDEFLREQLKADIGNAFGKAEDLATDMKVSLIFKDVAYESLVDQKFIETAREAMPGVEFLHDEFDAAKSG